MQPDGSLICDERLTNRLTCIWLWQPSGFPHLYYIHPFQKCQIYFDRNCPGETVCVFAEGFPMIQPGTARLHPKGTSSRFALRAPRRPAAASQSQVWWHYTVGVTARKFATAKGAPPPRKGDAASVRRQSRQRLRSERRYRRNRSVRFIVTLYDLEVPPRDCHGCKAPSQ